MDLIVVIGSDGSAGPRWIEAVGERHPREELARLAGRRRPMTAAERGWLDRFRAVVPGWARTLERWRAPFPGVAPPERVALLIGNQGGDDGFTADASTIGVDLSTWAERYGEAGGAEGDGRIRRILTHEYTHLLTRRWRTRHPVRLDTPLRRALWECFYEGLGNLRSLSPRWLTPAGAPSPHARRVEAALAPVFVEHVAALARAPGAAEEERLRARLSRGPFEKKWGALLVALWLADEARGDDRRLRAWVARGPEGILVLAEAHLPRPLADRLRDAVEAARAGEP